ncbi:LANO_0E01420g1_1 [Lachancea nothofagi CBS 11611]|uniref:LANO_0E01420g1_1 n=1 Tax=Lachancea nothofagi CBS 11611 TaxID=1266666 RepID=A0A1G4JPG5_9SACH|nr:LANO_0E01420g1_1 [Lachancea nothofagi CBS 11611]
MQLPVLVALFVNCIIVHCFEQDPWNNVSSVLNSLPKHKDCLIDSAQESDPYLVSDGGGIHITLPIDYFEEEQEHNWQRFFDRADISDRLAIYNDLVHSSDQFNNSDATYTLAQMHLLQDYGYPHNKTLAFHYMRKFNELTKYSNSSALFELGLMHTTGLFGTIPVDIPKGLIFFEKAAELGELRAIMSLAYRYSKGINVPQNKNRALFLYRSLALRLRQRYSEDEWNLFFPNVESYLVRIPDFNGGLLGNGLSSILSSVRRLRANRPDVTSSILTNLHSGNVILQFGSGYNDFIDDDVNDEDKIVDFYYSALDNYKGTYTQKRNVEMAATILNNTVEYYASQINQLDILQKFYYAKCLELWGHMCLTGEGLPKSDLEAAENYLNSAVTELKSDAEKAHFDLGLINQHFHHNFSAAVEHYGAITENYVLLCESGVQLFQLNKSDQVPPDIQEKVRNGTLPDFTTLLMRASSYGHKQALYEAAIFEEVHDTDTPHEQKLAFLERNFRLFVGSQENWVAPHIKDAFMALLRGETESGLWLYAQAAEQGIEIAQVNAAFLLYQPPYELDEPPLVPDERKLLAARYYELAAVQGNYDAAVIAGNVYFEMGNYVQAAVLYQSCILSSLGSWNLGYMYEYGLGVDQDFKMAKRHYKAAMAYNKKLFLGVKLSVMKVEIKSWLMWLTGSRFKCDWGVSADKSTQGSQESFHSRVLKKFQKPRQEDQKRSISPLNEYNLPHLEDVFTILGLLAFFLLTYFIRAMMGRQRRENPMGMNIDVQFFAI